jgi:hypothetical protein
MNRPVLISTTMLMVACGALPEEEGQALAVAAQALHEDGASAMPHYSKVLSVKQGFNFDKDKQDKVGFLTLLQPAGQELEADLAGIKDPERPTALLGSGAVAVLSSFDWNTGSTDAIYFSGVISTENRQNMAELLLGTWSGIEVEFEFSIYEYEPTKKAYFRAAYADKPLRGVIERTGSGLELEVSGDPSQEVQSPQNYAFRIGIKPQSVNQKVHLYVGEQRKVTKKWGITER